MQRKPRCGSRATEAAEWRKPRHDGSCATTEAAPWRKPRHDGSRATEAVQRKPRNPHDGVCTRTIQSHCVWYEHVWNMYVMLIMFNILRVESKSWSSFHSYWFQFQFQYVWNFHFEWTSWVLELWSWRFKVDDGDDDDDMIYDYVPESYEIELV